MVLENHDAKEPKVVDGRELIWTSHAIPHDHTGYTGQQGRLFARDHELLSSLKVRHMPFVHSFIDIDPASAWERYRRASLRPLRRLGEPRSHWSSGRSDVEHRYALMTEGAATGESH
jgi:hypothetical protein